MNDNIINALTITANQIAQSEFINWKQEWMQDKLILFAFLSLAVFAIGLGLGIKLTKRNLETTEDSMEENKTISIVKYKFEDGKQLRFGWMPAAGVNSRASTHIKRLTQKIRDKERLLSTTEIIIWDIQKLDTEKIYDLAQPDDLISTPSRPYMELSHA